MSNEIKFTTDGKKVVVVGKLNSQETIVQEIYISGGSEIPSGEHFVVKSLHDEPVVSWKETELKKLEERYEKERKEYNYLIDKKYKEFQLKNNELKCKLNYIGLVLKNANEKSFNTLVDFITGEIQWVVVDHYNYDLLPINKFNQMYEDKLRLFSIFGKDDGTFTYAVGDYYDYSGGNKKFYPFKTYDDALSKLKELVISSDVTENNIELSEKYVFELPKDKVNLFLEKQITSLNNNITNYDKTIENWKSNIENLSKRIK